MVESERRGVYGLNGIKITGGIPLQGEVQIQGSKNAALPMMAAALLNRELLCFWDVRKSLMYFLWSIF